MTIFFLVKTGTFYKDPIFWLELHFIVLILNFFIKNPKPSRQIPSRWSPYSNLDAKKIVEYFWSKHPNVSTSPSQKLFIIIKKKTFPLFSDSFRTLKEQKFYIRINELKKSSLANRDNKFSWHENSERVVWERWRG